MNIIKGISLYGEIAFSLVCTAWAIDALRGYWKEFKAWRASRVVISPPTVTRLAIPDPTWRQPPAPPAEVRPS